jgi:hypothetical protein
MTTLGPVLTKCHPSGDMLFAAVDPSARFIDPAVAATRFGARLKPFPDEATARDALDRACVATENGDNGTG